MCFTIPKKIISREGSRAVIEGNRSVDIGGLPDCSVGDYIQVTSGIAVACIPREEAESIRSLIKESYEQLS